MKNKFFQVENNDVLFNEKKEGQHLRIVPTSYEGVAVLPIMEDGKVMIQDEYRYTYEGYITQVVKGGLKEGQTPEDAEREELEEEMSLSYDKLIPLGQFVEHPSIVRQKGHAFVAMGCKYKENSLEAEETECFGNRRMVDFEELLASVMNNELECAVTQMLVLKVSVHFKK